MAAIYSRQQTQHAGSFASDVAALSLAGANIPLGIVQNAQLQFAQQIARIYDVSNSGAAQGFVPVYFAGGRTQGQASIARVLGPQSNALCEFYEKIGNVCLPQDLTFGFYAGCGTTVTNSVQSQVSYTAQASVLVNMAINIGAQDMIVNENLSLIFANLTCNSGAVAG